MTSWRCLHSRRSRKFIPLFSFLPYVETKQLVWQLVISTLRYLLIFYGLIHLAIVSSSDYIYLLNKDVNFIRDAYPNPATTGVPKHYAYFTDTSLIIGPSPNAAFDVEFHYGYYPATIVTAGTSWLGDDFDSALLNGALVEAIRFMKGEADMIDLYRKRCTIESLTLLGGLGDSTSCVKTRIGQGNIERR